MAAINSYIKEIRTKYELLEVGNTSVIRYPYTYTEIITRFPMVGVYFSIIREPSTTYEGWAFLGNPTLEINADEEAVQTAQEAWQNITTQWVKGAGYSLATIIWESDRTTWDDESIGHYLTPSNRPELRKEVDTTEENSVVKEISNTADVENDDALDTEDVQGESVTDDAILYVYGELFYETYTVTTFTVETLANFHAQYRVNVEEEIDVDPDIAPLTLPYNYSKIRKVELGWSADVTQFLVYGDPMVNIAKTIAQQLEADLGVCNKNFTYTMSRTQPSGGIQQQEYLQVIKRLYSIMEQYEQISEAEFNMGFNWAVAISQNIDIEENSYSLSNATPGGIISELNSGSEGQEWHFLLAAVNAMRDITSQGFRDYMFLMVYDIMIAGGDREYDARDQLIRVTYPTENENGQQRSGQLAWNKLKCYMLYCCATDGVNERE